ncbi:hypothetical protein P7C73_g2476, partial [Tremellales sp. Uapishka_1]
MPSDKHRPLARGEACRTCKGRKIRCPGEKPSCSRCSHLGKSCIYPDTPPGTLARAPASLAAPAPARNDNVFLSVDPTRFQPVGWTSLSPVEPSSSPSTLAASSSQLCDIFDFLPANHDSYSTQPRPVSNAATAPPSADFDSAFPWTPDFGLIPSVDTTGPVPPTDFQWDWNTINLQELLGLPTEEDAELSDVDRDHLYPTPLISYSTDIGHPGIQDLSHGSECDETLTGLMNAESPKGCTHHTNHSRLIKAVVLMHTAATRPPGDPQTRKALDRFVKDVSVENDGKTLSTDSLSLEFILLGTELFLKGAEMRAIPSPEIMEVVKRMLEAFKVLHQQDMGDHSVFIITIWAKMARLLVMESKRLEYRGDTTASANLNVDIEFITSCLRPRQQSIAQNAVMEIGTWKNTPPKQFIEEQVDDGVRILEGL